MRPAVVVISYMFEKLEAHMSGKSVLNPADLEPVCKFLQNFVLGDMQSRYSVAMLEFISEYADVHADKWLAARLKSAIRARLVVPPPRNN